MFDLKKMEEDIDMASLSQRLNLVMKKRGSTTFVECPNPEHAEREHDNCIVSRNNKFLYCFACGKSFGPFETVMLRNGCTFKKAIDTVGESLGGKDRYKISKSTKKPQAKKENSLFLRLASKIIPKSEVQLELKKYWNTLK